MSYRAGLGFWPGVPPREPAIVCDGCGLEAHIKAPPPAWFLDRKAKPGWRKVDKDGKRRDYCPRCKGAKP